jgi:hypothetical protein
MKNLGLFLSLFALTITVKAQQQEVVATAGEHNTNNNIQVSWTLGETVTETGTNTSAIITQGFHQTNLTVTQINNKYFNPENLNIQIYPNPTVNNVNLDIKGDNIPELYYKLTNETGKNINSGNLTNKTNIDFSNLDPSVYFITIYTKNNNYNKVFKIIKAKK